MLLQQSNHRELVIGLFQIMYEYNLHRPISLRDDDTAFQYLQAYWESDVARVGESQSIHWDSWYQAIQARQQLPTVITTPSSSLPQTDLTVAVEMTEVKKWLIKENDRSGKQWQPVHELDANEKDDATALERIVLFEDVRPYLFTLSNPILLEQLCLHFLSAAGLNFGVLSRGVSGFFGSSAAGIPVSIIQPQPQSSNSNTVKECFNHFQMYEQIQELGSNAETVQQLLLDHLHSNNRIMSPLFHNSTQSSSFISASSASHLHDLYHDPSAISFVNNLFSSFLSSFPTSNSLRVTYLSFQFSLAHNSQTEVASPLFTVRKVTKRLLKSDSTNLLLWNTYASLEGYYGHYQEAVHVYSSSLSLLHQLTASSLYYAPHLFWSFANLQLQTAYQLMNQSTSNEEAKKIAFDKAQQHMQLAIHILCSVSEDEYKPTDTEVNARTS